MGREALAHDVGGDRGRLGRTGTLSTKIALERLGLGPCYHMIEVFRTHPEHRVLWRRAAAGEQVDWSEIFSEYRSEVDWPACAFWRELAEAYPRVNDRVDFHRIFAGGEGEAEG